MDNTFDLDGIDWENVGPSEQPTGCKGRRSDLFSDLRRPLADVDSNRLVRGGGVRAPSCAEVCVSSSRRAGDEKLRRGGAHDVVPPTATARRRRCSKGRRQLNADESRCEPVDANMDSHAEEAPSTAAVRVSSPPHCNDPESAIDNELLGAQTRTAGDDGRPTCVSSAVDNTSGAAASGCTAQPKSFADSLTASFSAWAASSEPSMKRRCSGSGRRSNAHELPAWDLNVVDGVAEDDVHLTDDISFGRRPRRSLRLRRKSLVGQSLLENQEDSLLSCTVSCPTTSGLSSSCATAVSATLDEDAAVTAELPDLPSRLAESCQLQSRLSGCTPTVDFSWMATESSLDGTSEAAGSPSALRRSRIVPPPAVGEDGMHDILETAFMVSPENADSVCTRLDSIAEEECVEPCGSPSSVSESCQHDAAIEAVEPNTSCRPRRRAAIQQAQQQQPDQKRRRPSKLKQQQPSKLMQQQLPQEQFTVAVADADGDDDPVTDAALIGLYTNKPYQAPDRRRLETIYEQPGLWRGQEKLMSTAPTARLLKFEPVAIGKTKQRRQKALNLGWRRSATPDTASHERLEQCLKDLDEALLSVHERGGDRGCNVFDSTTASAASSNCEQLAAIETLALH